MSKDFEHWVVDMAGSIEDESEIFKGVDTSGTEGINRNKLSDLQIRALFAKMIMDNYKSFETTPEEVLTDKAYTFMIAFSVEVDQDGDTVECSLGNVLGEDRAEEWGNASSLEAWDFVGQLYNDIMDGWEPDD